MIGSNITHNIHWSDVGSNYVTMLLIAMISYCSQHVEEKSAKMIGRLPFLTILLQHVVVVVV